MRPAWTPHLAAGSEFDVPDLLADRSLAGCWTSQWSVNPHHQVLHDDRSGWITAAELEARSRAVAGRLAGQGLVSGDRILLSAAASAELVIAYVAAIRLGLVVVPVNTAYRPREVAQIVADADPAAAIVDDSDLGRWVQDAASRELLVVGTDVDLPEAALATLDAAGVHDGALLVYTSGTTGVPKGALLSHGNLLSSAVAVRIAWRWTREDRLVLCLPLFHLHGLGVGLNGTLCAGASMVLRPRFADDDVFDAITAHGATLFFGVPTMYRRLAESARAGELSRLRLCASGSAPLPAELFDAVQLRSGQAVLERYGMSETVMNVSNPYEGERRAGTVGFPLPGVEIRLTEGSGEIQVRGPNVFSGYWRRPPSSFTPDGWFLTGDAGRFDEDGYLRIVGRLKELIISGGYNVYPREVEDALRSHPAVSDIAVAGVPDPEWGERVTAFIVGDPSAEPELRRFAADTLAAYKRPKEFVFVAQLPRNAMGKVVVKELVDTRLNERR